jgi:PKD repeat protein
MRILRSTSIWRTTAALFLVLASFVFLSEAVAKNRTRAGRNASILRVSPTAPIGITAVPASGTIDTANQSLTYTDGPTAPNPTGVLGVPNCTAPNSCSDFVLTVNASALGGTKNLTWSVQWTPANVDLDIYILNANRQLVANNNSTVDPSVITLPIPPDGTVYHLVVSASVGTAPLNGSVSLTDKFPAAQQGAGVAPRYMNYPAASDQANGSNEPSMGVDWNPNDPSLKVIQGQTRLNTGGVAFFTGDTIQYRADFDDCSSPAINTWTDKNAPIVTGLDPIGFVDHSAPPTSIVGVGDPSVRTPGRVFGLDLAAGTSTCAFSDDDGATWTSVVAGNYPAGPDHETLGGGPFHPPVPTPPAPAYPNAIYYCSQNGVQNAECSRSDDGGITYGPGVPIFDATVCGGGIHGHLKVSPQGTVYVPNSSCGEGTPVGANGVATSTNNGITWEERNVPGSTGSQDPAIGIGQNNIGKPAGQVPNTIYLGWTSGDGHAHVAHSPDEGVTWEDDTDISSIIGSENSVFPIVVAGDDNRAAYAFLGTVPTYQPKKVWHLYVATTYNGGKNWILVDATPDDPVQIGNVCLLGIGCSGGRNLLDFNGIDVDSEGRVLIGYTDGCINCSNTQNITQSSSGHGTIARQSGGKRLFSAFDPAADQLPPAAPQFRSVVRQDANSVLLTWLKPDNGGSPITGYKIYRSDASGAEMFLTQVSGELTLKYLDPNAPTTSNWFYRVTAVNAIGDSTYCRELSVNGVQPGANACQLPYLQVQGTTAAATDPTGQFSIQYLDMGEPFKGCTAKNLTAVLKVNTMDPSNTGTAVVPPVSTYEVYFKIPGSANSTGQPQTMFVEYDNTTLPQGGFFAGWVDPATGSDCSAIYAPGDPANPVSGTIAPDGTITMNLNFGNSPTFGTCAATGGTAMTVNAATWVPGLQITNIQGKTFQRAGGIITGVKVTKAQTPGDGSYTTKGNLACLDVRPTAVLTANPMFGTPPLTVNFSGAASSDANPCTTISTYTLDFGDGTTPMTQTSPFFTHTYNNVGDYAARLTVTDSAGQKSDSSQIVVSVNTGAIQLAGAVSRKVHGSAGPFDLNLTLNGPPAIECRSGEANNEYQVILVFPDALTSVAGASSSVGVVSTSGPGTDPHQYVVNVSGVTTGQYLTVTLNGVHDVANHSGDVSVTMGVLVGDTTGNGAVNSSDVAQTQSQSGQVITKDTFRNDVTANGAINSADISTIQSRSGTGLPAHP